MASNAKTVAFIVDQGSGLGNVRAKALSGEYGLYCDDRMAAMICDDQLFAKPTLAGQTFASDTGYAPPYPGTKPCWVIDSKHWQDAAWLSELFRVSAAGLPAPGAKAKRAP